MNDISKASFLISMYKVIKRKKDPIQRAKLYDMIFDYVYQNIEPSEDDEFYDLFLSWQPQMDFDIKSKTKGKEGRLQRQKKSDVTDSFSNFFPEPKQTFFNPYASNCVTENVESSVESSDVVQKNVEENTEKLQKDWGKFQKDSFELISEHNKSVDYDKRLHISHDFISYIQKECREIVAALRSESPETILFALKNYLQVTKSATWKKSFSLQNFIKDFEKYADKDFNLKPFLKDSPTGNSPQIKRQESPEQLEQQLLADMRNNPEFIPTIFTHYKDEWVSCGCPQGTRYFDFQNEMCLSGYGQKLKSEFLSNRVKGA